MGEYYVEAKLEMQVADRKGDAELVAGGMTPDEVAVSEAENVLEDELADGGYGFRWSVSVPEVTGTYNGGKFVNVRLTGESSEEFHGIDDAWEAAEEELDHLGTVKVVSVSDM